MMVDNKKKQETKDQETVQNSTVESENESKSSQKDLSTEEKLKERWSGNIEVHNVDDISDDEHFDAEDMGDYI